MQNFIQIGIADSIEQSWIGQCSPERVILPAERGGEFL